MGRLISAIPCNYLYLLKMRYDNDISKIIILLIPYKFDQVIPPT